MSTSKKIEYKNKQDKVYIPHAQLNFLNEKEMIFVNTSFLYYIEAYYQIINKKDEEIFRIINNILYYSKYNPNSTNNPLYLPISVLDAKKIITEIPEKSIRKTAFRKTLTDELERISSYDAYNLLTKDVINTQSDFFKKENRWILHSLYVGMAARRIAIKLNLNREYAAALGYLHDIGRKFQHENHVMLGYQFLENLGLYKEARICLTHSFLNNDITLTAGSGPKDPENYNFINNFLMQNPVNGYDKIIQLCDLFASEKGFTTLEKRMLDLTTRKGVFDNSLKHFNQALDLKKEIESAMGCSLYDLFKEIKVADINSIKEDQKQLRKMFKQKTKILK